MSIVGVGSRGLELAVVTLEAVRVVVDDGWPLLWDVAWGRNAMLALRGLSFDSAW